MAHKAICAHLWFEIPHHKTRIHRSRCCNTDKHLEYNSVILTKLFHIWIEVNTCNCISVALEMPLQSGILLNTYISQMPYGVIEHTLASIRRIF